MALRGNSDTLCQREEEGVSVPAVKTYTSVGVFQVLARSYKGKQHLQPPHPSVSFALNKSLDLVS